MKKTEITKINEYLRSAENFEVVNLMLEIISKNDGKVYDILNRRVVFKEEVNGKIEIHDALVYAE